jgi:hypothetical protein
MDMIENDKTTYHPLSHLLMGPVNRDASSAAFHPAGTLGVPRDDFGKGAGKTGTLKNHTVSRTLTP